MKKNLINLTFILIIQGISILIYFKYILNKYKDDFVNHDPLNKKIINLNFISKNCCSWWPISHFISFAILSYLWPPKYSIILFVYGVLWEIFEGIMNTMETKKGDVVKHQSTRNGSSNNVEYVTWWAASNKDILFNTIGIVLGRVIKKNI